MRVFIFGSNGMLGSYLVKYLMNDFDVVPITRNDIDLSYDFNLIFEKYQFQNEDVIVNAAGIIKQRNYSSAELIRVNSLFPHFLSDLNCNVIHITTDCVFSGKEGSYNEYSPHDCLDDYGKSKSLGECEDLTIIRTSIIGEELKNKKSLLEWVKSNKNKNINGYLNHFWNGVTCLELSKHISEIIKTNSYWKGVRHYFSPDTVSKYQLVSYINEVYELGNNVIPVMEKHCDRSLTTSYNSPVQTKIKDQIIELKKYSIKLLLSNEEKLKNFPTINFVSAEGNEDRRKSLYENFEKQGINSDKVIPHIYKRYTKESGFIDKIKKHESDLRFTHGDEIVELDFVIDNIQKNLPSYFGAVTSHLKAIKEWYETTDEPYAIFCEDDLSFDTVSYWNFTWEEFFERLPDNWECIQLSVLRDYDVIHLFWTPDIHFRTRCWCDWSCLCYLITREHAKKLLDNYYSEEVFSFDYKGIDRHYRYGFQFALKPYVENIIYTLFEPDTIFSFPLFLENTNFQTTVWEANTNKRYECYHEIFEWWKTKGTQKSLDEIFINQ